MGRVILLVILTIVSNRASAELTTIAINTKGGFSTYADPASITRNGNVAILVTVDDYKTPQEEKSGKKYLSIAKQEEFDCIAGTSRFLSYSTYAGNFTMGGVVSSASNLKDDGHQIILKSFGETKWKIACDKK